MLKLSEGEKAEGMLNSEIPAKGENDDTKSGHILEMFASI